LKLRGKIHFRTGRGEIKRLRRDLHRAGAEQEANGQRVLDHAKLLLLCEPLQGSGERHVR
jgi:hypothetical protein